MTMTRNDLDTKLANMFLNCKDVEAAKAEILVLFSKEPDDEHRWTEQYIYVHTKSSILLAIIAINVDRLTSLLIRWLFWVLFGKPFAVAC